MVHALLFLRDLDDLLSFASTSSAAYALLRAHWSRLQPDGAYFRQKFVAAMEALCTPCRVSRMWQRLPPPPPPATSGHQLTTSTEMRVIIPSRSNHHMNYNIDRSGTVLATSVRITARWKEDPTACVKIMVGGSFVVRVDSTVARMEILDGSDTLDVVATVLHRLPLHLLFHDVQIVNRGSTDVEVCWTEHRLPEEQSWNQRLEWRVDVLTKPVSVIFDASDSTVRFRNIAGEAALVDYLALCPAEQLPPVERFTLFSYCDDGRKTHSIPGWACRVAGGYKVPLGGLNLCCLDSHCLKVKFRSSSSSAADHLEVVAYARARGVAVEDAVCMGVLS